MLFAEIVTPIDTSKRILLTKSAQKNLIKETTHRPTETLPMKSTQYSGEPIREGGAREKRTEKLI
ncbi:hypothetical protein, partial [Pantoea sp. QMID1]|uniref:hypothetical protein n=1 Tax=Pantoea sp. QMID1 TaxID=3016790 RepID=UPI0025568210